MNTQGQGRDVRNKGQSKETSFDWGLFMKLFSRKQDTFCAADLLMLFILHPLPYPLSFKGELELGQKIPPPPSNHLPPREDRGWSLDAL